MLALPVGDAVTPAQVAKDLEGRYPKRFGRSTAVATAQRLASTWAQAGYLVGKVKKKRARLAVTPAAVAAQVGFAIPPTRVANHLPDRGEPVWSGGERAAVKALDTFLLRVGTEDAFFYTQCLPAAELERHSLSEMPVVFQKELAPKIDLRVTVVGDRVFPVAVVEDGAGIAGDWRLRKGTTDFVPHALPADVGAACARLVKRFGLAFGAIDLALVVGTYYFLEINPTGELFWLVDRLSLPIPEALTDALCAGRLPAAT